MTTVAEILVETLAHNGIRQLWGVVGDALNPVTDAIRRTEGMEWIGVRHEEVGAFAASAQAQLTGSLAVCMGTVGPGAIHLLNGLYDAKKSHAPVLAIIGQVPMSEMGSDYFQEVDNQTLFADVACFHATITSGEQMPSLLEQAANAALEEGGVAVLSIPGDVGLLDVPKGVKPVTFVGRMPRPAAPAEQVAAAAEALEAAEKVTLLVGMGAREAREDVLRLADALAAPMVLTLKAKEGLERDNDYQVGQSGLIGNPAAQAALEGCDTLVLLGTDFPYRDFYPEGKTVVQVDIRGRHIGRRTAVDHPVIGDCAATIPLLLQAISRKQDRSHLDSCRSAYQGWQDTQQALTDPGYDASGLVAKVRSAVDNPQDRIRPEALAAAVDRHAADDAILTSDTGMSTVWLSRFVELRGTRRLVGSYNLGSMANAMPQALGAQALDRDRQVIAFCGDGGLTMLLGDLLTAVAYDLPATFVVFDNGRLGMVKLEMEQVGLPEFGTVLANPDLAAVATACGLTGIRVEDPADLDAAVRQALATRGPVLLDVLTNPQEVSVPPKPTISQALGFAKSKIKEQVVSAGEPGR